MIMTVTGKINKNDLGRTLPHEHVIETAAGFNSLFPEITMRESVLEEAKKQFRELAQNGIQSVIDTTTYDIGRDPEFLRELSSSSGVQIICSTGCYLQVTPAFENQTEETIAELFIREIRSGIGKTGIKPGVIKVATGSQGFTETTVKMFKAASLAHLETGLPITTHTYAQGKTGIGQLEIFNKYNIDLSKVCIGHSDDSGDLDYLTELCQSGAFVAFDKLYPVDRLGSSPNVDERISNLINLLNQGFASTLMISHDWSIHAPAFWPKKEEDLRKTQNPDGYLYITRRVIPELIDNSIQGSDIDRMMVTNPSEFLNH